MRQINYRIFAIISGIIVSVLLLAALSYAAYEPFYKEATVICKLKKISNVNGEIVVLDLPFPITSKNVVCEGKQFYGYPIPISHSGKDCIAHITFKAEYLGEVLRFSGYMPNPLKDARYKAHFAKTMSEYKATSSGVMGTITPYNGTDKGDPAPFCVNLDKNYIDK